MDMIQDYDSGSSNSEDEIDGGIREGLKATSSVSSALTNINAAPEVADKLNTNRRFLDNHQKVIKHNPSYEFMYAPVQGPTLPGQNLEKSLKNTLTGHKEVHHMDKFSFDEAFYTMNSRGFTVNPKLVSSSSSSGGDHVGDVEQYSKYEGKSVYEGTGSRAEKKERKRKRKPAGDPSDIDGYNGPWGGPVADEDRLEELREEAAKQKEEYDIEQKRIKAAKEAEKKAARVGSTADNDEDEDESSGEDEDEEPDVDDGSGELDKAGTKAGEKKRKKNLPPSKQEVTEYLSPEPERDYQGRSYLHCDAEFRNKDEDHQCYIPKKWEHTWHGHTGPVTAIRWFPKTGHLLLSASMDCSLRLWNVNTHRKCVRTFNGHLNGIRDITFNGEGDKFLSVSYDKYIKLWDTETGKCIHRFSSGKIPYTARFNPGNENEFLVGQKDKLVVGWDVRQNTIIQRYEEHLSSVNTVTFIDYNRRFVSSSDDKKIFVWEYGIPVVIKHISEPHMHSVPFIMLHPNEKWFVGTSLDNQVVVYSTQNRFRINRKKQFTGHNVAGYACQVDVSPNGQFVVSGDSEGRCFFWDWKTTKVYKRLRCHDKVTMGAIWHPVHPSKVATCSWDGTIKYWD